MEAALDRNLDRSERLPEHGVVEVKPPEAALDQLTKTEAALLRYFKAHENQVVSTEQLLADIWKRPDASNRRVQEAIRRLRLQLEELDKPIGTIENCSVAPPWRKRTW